MQTRMTWSERQPMPRGRGGEMARATGETPGTEYVYQLAQDLLDPHSAVDLVVTSLTTGHVYAATADWRECRDQGTDVWGLLIGRLARVTRSAPDDPGRGTGPG